MYIGSWIAEVTGLSPNATEKEVFEFFSYCGKIEHLEIIRCGESTCTAYVVFKEAHALQTAVLLSGSIIANQSVCISPLEAYLDKSEPQKNHLWGGENGSSSGAETNLNQFISTPGEAVTVAQQVVTTMISKGYVLSKDALNKAKAFDESHQVSSNAAAKVAELSKRLGFTDKINSGLETAKSIDEKYHVTDITKSVASFTGRTAVAAANAVVNSSYFASGALWVSDVLHRAANAAADLGNKNVNK